MLKRTFFSLTLCLSCALLLAACGGAETNSNSSNASSTTTTTNKNTTSSTVTTSPPATASSPSTASSPAATVATGGDKIGIAECDDYLDKYEACVTGKVPEAARAQYNSAMEMTRKSWQSLAGNPQTRSSLAAACKMAAEQSRQSMKSYGCDF